MLKHLAVALALVGYALNSQAADFSFVDTRGETQTLAQYHGRWVLLNLWATWCAPCLKEMPELEALSQSRKDLAVIGLAVDGNDARRVTLFVEKLHVTYPIVAGSMDSVKQFKPRGFPTSILYDPFGRQVLLKEGVISRAEIEAQITAGKSTVSAKPLTYEGTYAFPISFREDKTRTQTVFPRTSQKSPLLGHMRSNTCLFGLF